MIDRVFVYGTLMPGQPRWSVLAPYASGTPTEAQIFGRLVDTRNGYPGLVDRWRDAQVSGVVVPLDHGRTNEAVALLDEIQGVARGLFARQAVVTLDGVLCWTYLYLRATGSEPDIGGRWTGERSAEDLPDDPPISHLGGREGWSFYLMGGADGQKATAFRGGEFVFCKEGADDGILARAEKVVPRLSSNHRPHGDPLAMFICFRDALGLVGADRMEVGDWAGNQHDAADTLEHLVSVFALQLPAGALVTTYIWPDHTASTRPVRPDPAIAAHPDAASRRWHREEAERAEVRLAQEEAEEARRREQERQAEHERLNDPTEITVDDVRAAVQAVTGKAYLKNWGAAILSALSPLDSEHRLWFAEETERTRAKICSPFSGFIEAPTSIVELYQVHGQRLEASRDAHVKALDALLDDTVGRFLSSLERPVTWGDLASQGAQRQKPVDPNPCEDDFW